MKPPSLESVRAAIDRLDPERDLADARLILAVPVGSWADGQWRPGDDVDLRAVYVLSPTHYLGIASYRDELERVFPEEGFELDLVAFEVEKLARLILKGHRQTLAWLAGDAPSIVSSPSGERLRKLARLHVESIEADDSPQRASRHDLYKALDELVRLARLGGV